MPAWWSPSKPRYASVKENHSSDLQKTAQAQRPNVPRQRIAVPTRRPRTTFPRPAGIVPLRSSTCAPPLPGLCSVSQSTRRVSGMSRIWSHHRIDLNKAIPNRSLSSNKLGAVFFAAPNRRIAERLASSLAAQRDRYQLFLRRMTEGRPGPS